MAALDFPSSPTGGQKYTLNGVSYYYDATIGAWLTTVVQDPLITSVAHVGNTPPTLANTQPGDIWFNTDLLRMFVYYNDGTSGQWVEPAYSTAFPQYDLLNAAFTVANAAFAAGNTEFTFTNTVYAAINSAFGVINAVYTSSNSDYVVSNAAFGIANTALQNTTGTFAGTLTVTGNVCSNFYCGNVMFKDGTSLTTLPPPGVPTGTLISYPTSNAPNGYLCTSSAYLQSAYPTLYSCIGTISYGANVGIRLTGCVTCQNVCFDATSSLGWGCIPSAFYSGYTNCFITGAVCCGVDQFYAAGMPANTCGSACIFSPVDSLLMTCDSCMRSARVGVYFSCTNIYSCVTDRFVHCIWCVVPSAAMCCGFCSRLCSGIAIRNNCTNGCGCWYLCYCSPVLSANVAACCSATGGTCSGGIAGCVVSGSSPSGILHSILAAPAAIRNLCYTSLIYSGGFVGDSRCRALLVEGNINIICGTRSGTTCSGYQCANIASVCGGTAGYYLYHYTNDGGVTWNSTSTGMPCVQSFPAVSSGYLANCCIAASLCTWPTTPLTAYNPISDDFLVIPQAITSRGCLFCYSSGSWCQCYNIFQQIMKTSDFVTWTCTPLTFSVCYYNSSNVLANSIISCGSGSTTDVCLWQCGFNPSSSFTCNYDMYYDLGPNGTCCWYIVSRSCNYTYSCASVTLQMPNSGSYWTINPSTGCVIKYFNNCCGGNSAGVGQVFLKINNGYGYFFMGCNCNINIYCYLKTCLATRTDVCNFCSILPPNCFAQTGTNLVCNKQFTQQGAVFCDDLNTVGSICCYSSLTGGALSNIFRNTTFMNGSPTIIATCCNLYSCFSDGSQFIRRLGLLCSTTPFVQYNNTYNVFGYNPTTQFLTPQQDANTNYCQFVKC